MYFPIATADQCNPEATARCRCCEDKWNPWKNFLIKRPSTISGRKVIAFRSEDEYHPYEFHQFDYDVRSVSIAETYLTYERIRCVNGMRESVLVFLYRDQPFVVTARTFGRDHLICRFCHKEHSELQEKACPDCFKKSHRYRKTVRRSKRCVLCKQISPVFANEVCEDCYNDRKGAFCGARCKDFGNYPCDGCISCHKDRLVNGFAHCEECYNLCSVHPVRLCTRCDQYGLHGHVRRDYVDGQFEPCLTTLSRQQSQVWREKFCIIEDLCKSCWEARCSIRKQKSNLFSAVQGLKSWTKCKGEK